MYEDDLYDLTDPLLMNNHMPTSLTRLFCAQLLTAEELRFDLGASEILRLADQGDEKSQDVLETSLRCFLNLMRQDCGLGFQHGDVDTWSPEDLEKGPWGNPYTPSTKNTNSPHPGFFYRMVQKNWRELCMRLAFWDYSDPERVNPNRANRLLKSKKREAALKILNKSCEQARFLSPEEAPPVVEAGKDPDPPKKKRGRPKKKVAAPKEPALTVDS